MNAGIEQLAEDQAYCHLTREQEIEPNDQLEPIRESHTMIRIRSNRPYRRWITGRLDTRERAS